MVSKYGLFLVLVGTVMVDVLAQNNLNGILPIADQEKMLARIGPSLQKCIEESGVDPKELEIMEAKPSTEKRCFLKCLLLATKLIDADGTIRLNELKGNLQDFGFPEDRLDGAVECLTKVEQKIQNCEDMIAFEKCRAAFQ